MNQQNPPNDVQTIEIDNFGGRLTRKLNGELNSGFANFNNSYGYDPFSKPGNLTWLEQPSSVSGTTDLILAGKMRSNGENTPALYAIGSTGKYYRIIVNDNINLVPSVNSVIGISSVVAGSATYTKGASIEFFGQNEKAYVSNDYSVNSIGLGANFGVGESVIGTGANYANGRSHPLKQFAGKLVFGNGPTIGVIDATNTITSSIIGVSTDVGNIYSQLNPPLPVEANVVDLDVSPDTNYLLITAVNAKQQTIVDSNAIDFPKGLPVESNIFYWNGSDPAVTAATTFPNNYITSLQTYLQNNMFFINDTFGAGLSDGTHKVLTLTKNQAPLPNATGANGDFLYWMAPETADKVVGSDATPTMFASLYYFGSLDEQSEPGLYRLLRLSPQNGYSTTQIPFNQVVSNQFYTTNSTNSSVISVGYSQHFFSTLQAAPFTSVLSFKSVSIPSSGLQSTQTGIYQTQTQIFGKRITIKQLRVYTEPTVANNSFTLECIGSDGNIITNGSFSYTYAAGTDLTLLQGALERIDFNPTMKDLYSLGIRIKNAGTVNMTIKKIEVDYTFSGK